MPDQLGHVSAEVQAVIYSNGVASKHTPLIFFYTAKAPFSVFMAEGSISWEFSRDLLLEALQGTPSGTGDVRCRVEGGFFILELTGDTHNATIAMRKLDLELFLTASYVVVPAGMEDVSTEIDEDLNKLLDS